MDIIDAFVEKVSCPLGYLHSKHKVYWVAVPSTRLLGLWQPLQVPKMQGQHVEAACRKAELRPCTHHEGDHDGEPIGDLVGGLDEDDSQADGHADHSSQERCCPDQCKGSWVDVIQANVTRAKHRALRLEKPAWEPVVHLQHIPHMHTWCTFWGGWRPGVRRQPHKAVMVQTDHWAQRSHMSSRRVRNREGRTGTGWLGWKYLQHKKNHD